MLSDDPRHGTYAGYMAHRADDESSCTPCLTAHRRHTKLAKIRLAHGVRNRIPLGQDAWNILDTHGFKAVSVKAKVSRNNLYLLHRLGPEKTVLRSTRDAILKASTTHTTIGIQRRLRALSAMGYPMTTVAPIVGCHPEPLVRLMRRHRAPYVVKHHVATGVLLAFDQLHMTPPPANSVTKRRRTEGAARGWVVPLAWDDIDDPNEQPNRGRDHYGAPHESIDEARVERILGGDWRLRATRAERREVARRWRGDMNELSRLTGWKSERYWKRQEPAA